MTLGSLNIEAGRFDKQISISKKFKDQGFTQGRYNTKHGFAVLKKSNPNDKISFDNVIREPSKQVIKSRGLTLIGRSTGVVIYGVKNEKK